MDNFTLIASTEIEAEGESSANGKDFDIFVATAAGCVDLAAAYQNFDVTPATSDDVDMGGGWQECRSSSKKWKNLHWLSLPSGSSVLLTIMARFNLAFFRSGRVFILVILLI